MFINNLISTQNKRSNRFIITISLTLCILLAGCGGGRLIPRELKDYVAYTLKMERRLVNLIDIFRTEVILSVKPMTIANARKEEVVLIETCVEYFRRDNITDFINDSLVFVIRLNTDPDVRIKWFTVADDMRKLVNDEMTIKEFADRCRKEENWADDF
jgi:hypothetical protein